MYTMPHVYDFGFLFPHENQAGLPQLTFTIDHAQFAGVFERIAFLASSPEYQAHALKYVPDSVPFVPLTHEDLFGKRAFGYGAAGLVTETSDAVTIAILCHSRDSSRASALTLHIVLTALNYYERCVQLPNREQTAILNTIAEDRSMGYGHAVSGSVDASILRYLHAVAPATGRAALPPEVSSAIWTTWQQLAKNDSTSLFAALGGLPDWHHDDCRASITSDARFLLECPGNACDIGIYPQGYSGTREEGGAQFSCHNLDAAHQQLALLAGLGMLCRLARARNA